MSSITLEEGNLIFAFSDYLTAVKFDDKSTNPHGLEPVDFVAETDECIYFIEVKDYQHPHPKAVSDRERNRKLLLSAAKEQSSDGNDSLYCHKIGSKFKDSILRKYVTGDIDKNLDKKIVYLLFINLDTLGANERGMLKVKISNHVPIGLRDSRHGLFPDMLFELVNVEQLKKHGIICTAKNKEGGTI